MAYNIRNQLESSCLPNWLFPCHLYGQSIDLSSLPAFVRAQQKDEVPHLLWPDLHNTLLHSQHASSDHRLQPMER